MTRWFARLAASIVLAWSPFTLAKSCPMPTLEAEFDKAEAVVVARRRAEVQLLSLEVTLVVLEVKHVHKGEAFSWILVARLPETHFPVDPEEDGVWFLRGRLYGLPELNDCGYSTAASEKYVMSFVESRGVARRPVSIGWCAPIPVVGVLGLWLILRRGLRDARFRSSVKGNGEPWKR